MATQAYEQTQRPLPSRRRVRLAIRSQRTADAGRRALNVAVAAIGLILAFPLMLVIAVAIWLTSPGPILYTQVRIGLDRRSRRPRRKTATRHRDAGGKPFTMYKFRTMRVQEDGGRQVWAGTNDSRVTPIGGVLRKLRLDELPQLVNVLRGEMNVVGPRPEQPQIFEQLRETISDYPRRQRVLPGITGFAQVNLCYDQTIDDVRKKLEYDLAYIRQLSPVEDLKIMLQTLPVMLGRRLGW
jgi:lipopolysaccharide/colanic/teichoic acid biosynthesis glycosyltransferase